MGARTGGVPPSAQRLEISLEPIGAPRIDWMHPDGSVMELPPSAVTDPAVLCAGQVNGGGVCLHEKARRRRGTMWRGRRASAVTALDGTGGAGGDIRWVMGEVVEVV